MAKLILSPEYSTDVPLSGMPLEGLNLPGSLYNRLGDWQQFFDNNFNPGEEPPWTSVEAREWWSDEGGKLAEDLRYALPIEIELEVDLWPLRSGT